MWIKLHYFSDSETSSPLLEFWKQLEKAPVRTSWCESYSPLCPQARFHWWHCWQDTFLLLSGMKPNASSLVFSVFSDYPQWFLLRTLIWYLQLQKEVTWFASFYGGSSLFLFFPHWALQAALRVLLSTHTGYLQPAVLQAASAPRG